MKKPETTEAHPDDIAVDRFAAAMKVKLSLKRAEGRGGWENRDECSAEHLSYLLIQHCLKGDPLDVGNLAMMLQQRGDRIVIDDETASIMGRPEPHAATVDDLWQELCNYDDRTSPDDYPDMCLISRDELADFVSRITPPASAIREAQEPVASLVDALAGQYGFENAKAVDTRHFGPPYNEFPPLTYGDLRRLVAALAGSS